MLRILKSFKPILLLVALLSLWLLSACQVITGSGNVVEERREVSGFNQIEITGSGDLIIEQSGEESLLVIADDNLLPILTSNVAGGQLILGTKSNTSIMNGKIEYHVTVKSLEGLEITGSSDTTIHKLDGDQLDIQISGSGTVTGNGSVSKLNIEISGSGEYDGAIISSQDATVSVSGSGDVLVNASQTLDADVSGSGSVVYVGNPDVQQSVSGSGSVRQQ
ncbi:MAG: head GIN domain-containing protein [Caldilineaceae bacterium]